MQLGVRSSAFVDKPEETQKRGVSSKESIREVMTLRLECQLDPCPKLPEQSPQRLRDKTPNAYRVGA